MKGNIAIIAALPGELKPLVRDPSARWKRLASAKGTEVWEYRHKDGCWIAACAGMGADRARLALAEVEKVMKIDAVCSVGWAGALIASVPAASVWWIREVVDTGTGERFQAGHFQEDHFQEAQGSGEAVVLATTSRVADGVEKRRLAASYGAALVDMEAAAVARLAAARSIPFYSIKAVSDDADARLPDINPFIKDGQLTMVPFLLHVAVRPRTWAALMKLGKNSSLAARNMASAIYNRLDERAYARRGNGDYL